MDKQPIDLEPFIKNIVPLFQSELEKNKNKLEVDVEVGAVVTADPDRLNQILHNLISNAIKFTKEGQIKISTLKNKEEKRITVCVADTGIGMDDSDRHIIFSRFEKIDYNSKGLGLGLNITKHLVEAHDGEIWVDSEVGEGSKFYFFLPRSDKPLSDSIKSIRPKLFNYSTSPSLSSSPKLKSNDNNNHSILIVDDDPINMRSIESILSEDYNLVMVHSGEEALDQIKFKKPDLVLLDIMMIEMDGIEVCKRIRDIYDDVELPVIFQTARNDNVTFENAYDYGGNDYITKPFSKIELIRRVKKQLELSRKLDGIEQILKEKEKTVYIETKKEKKNHAFLYTDNNKTFIKMVRIPLKTICRHADLFIQISRSVAINIDYIDSVEKTKKNRKTSYLIKLKVELEKEIDFYSNWSFNENVQKKLDHLIIEYKN